MFSHENRFDPNEPHCSQTARVKKYEGWLLSRRLLAVLAATGNCAWPVPHRRVAGLTTIVKAAIHDNMTYGQDKFHEVVPCFDS
jgi:hypothetical protein